MASPALAWTRPCSTCRETLVGTHGRNPTRGGWTLAGLLCALLIVDTSCVNKGFGELAHEAETACGPSLLLLPSSTDPNTDVLFNMQTRKMEEAVHIAAVSGRTLVEPSYVFGARNWTWFEDAHHNQLASNADIHQGVLGTIQEPLSSFFELDPLQHLLQRLIPSLTSHVSTCGTSLDLIVRFYGHSSIASCDPSAMDVTAWGVTWAARRVECVHAHELQTLEQLLDIFRDSQAVALEYLPPKFVEQRHTAWRASPARTRVREALSWAAPLVAEADTFIKTHFAPFRNDDVGRGDADVGDEGEGRVGGGGGGGLGHFVAVHWRRGDRGYQEEMGIHGHVDVALTAPARMVHYVQEVVSDLQMSVHGEGVRACVCACV